jgi:probable O-glycosylation ligase (exosortase A-associated)
VATAFSLVPDLAWPKWDLVVKTLIMSVLITSMATNKVRIHALVWILALSLGFYGVKGGVFTLTSGGENRVFGPASSYISDNNHLALALIMAVPLMNYLRLHSAQPLVKLGLLAAMVLSAMSAIFTYSRGGLLGLGAMGIVFWWRSRQKLLFTVLFAVGIAGVLIAAPERWMERMQSIGAYQEDGSAISRLEIWGAALRITAGNPLFGGGFRATHSQAVVDKYARGVTARAVHNSHIEILVENGVFAFTLHIALILGTWFYASRTMRLARNHPELAWARDLAAMLQASLVAYIVGGSFLSLAYYDGWWYLAILAVATHAYVLNKVPRAAGFMARSAGMPVAGGGAR